MRSPLCLCKVIVSHRAIDRGARTYLSMIVITGATIEAALAAAAKSVAIRRPRFFVFHVFNCEGVTASIGDFEVIDNRVACESAETGVTGLISVSFVIVIAGSIDQIYHKSRKQRKDERYQDRREVAFKYKNTNPTVELWI